MRRVAVVLMSLVLAGLGAAAPPGIARGATTPTPAFRSGGLGLSRHDWEAKHGKGVTPTSGSASGSLAVSVWAYEFYGGVEKPGAVAKYLVTYWGNDQRNGNVWNISYQWDDGQEGTMAEARALSRSLLPADAAFVRSGTDQQGDPMDVYSSHSLVARYDASDADPWGGGPPGSISVDYGLDPTGTGVTDFAIGTGNTG